MQTAPVVGTADSGAFGREHGLALCVSLLGTTLWWPLASTCFHVLVSLGGGTLLAGVQGCSSPLPQGAEGARWRDTDLIAVSPESTCAGHACLKIT